MPEARGDEFLSDGIALLARCLRVLGTRISGSASARARVCVSGDCGRWGVGRPTGHYPDRADWNTESTDPGIEWVRLGHPRVHKLLRDGRVMVVDAVYEEMRGIFRALPNDTITQITACPRRAGGG